ncbi:GAF domain-containing sensor histidine kinase [Mycolicibacterium septicum]|uniref:GAF domain-containing sensor histidine kinase n=1 Tax=Mycolicibacterium septicum TaxID=98668 RepID=UPI00235E3ACC|nr:GAF domain-containing protein [Mycolicibacterium septicum]
MKPVVRQKLSGTRALGFVEVARAMLGADAVTLSGGSDRVASAGAPTDLTTETCFTPTALRTEVLLNYDVSRDMSGCTVSGDGVTPLTLRLEWRGRRTLPPRLQVAVRALARSAAPAVGVSESASVSERLTVSGSQILAELALTAESLDELLGGITVALGLLVGGTAAGVSIPNDRGQLQMLSGSFGAAENLIGSALVDRTRMATSAAEVFRSGRTDIANDPNYDDCALVGNVEMFGVHRLMTVPMSVGDCKYGVVQIANRAEPFGRQQVELADRLIPLVAAAVAQVRQRHEMLQREAHVLAISRATEAIAAGLGTFDIGPYLETFRQALHCRAIVLTLQDRSCQIALGDAAEIESATGFLGSVDAQSGAVRSAMRRPVEPADFGWVSVQFPVMVDGEVRATLALLRTPWLPFQMYEHQAIKRMCETVALAWKTEICRREQGEIERVSERARIADDIHDRVAQLLFAGRMSLQKLQEELSLAPAVVDVAERHARHALEMLVRSERELREVINQSSALQRLPFSLAKELCTIIAEVEHQFGVEIGLDLLHGDGLPDLGIPQGMAVLAGAREAIVNAAKHAGPCTITVVLERRCTGGVRLRVVDDGVGDLLCGTVGHGLNAMRRRLAEQSASVVIRRGPHGGTEVIIEASAGETPAVSREGGGAAMTHETSLVGMRALLHRESCRRCRKGVTCSGSAK